MWGWTRVQIFIYRARRQNRWAKGNYRELSREELRFVIHFFLFFIFSSICFTGIVEGGCYEYSRNVDEELYLRSPPHSVCLCLCDEELVRNLYGYFWNITKHPFLRMWPMDHPTYVSVEQRTLVSKWVGAHKSFGWPPVHIFVSHYGPKTISHPRIFKTQS